MPSIDAAAQTVFADLNQRCADAEFDRDFPENGKFIRRTIKAREYWYYQGYDAATGTKSNRYVGTVADSETTRRVEAHDRQRVDYRTRIDAVRMLRSAGFPTADALTGRVVERLAQAGFFRLRGVLVGTVAFQTYPGLVGERPMRALRTGDIDLAQDYGISVAIGESMPPVHEELQAVDASFRPVPNLSRPDYTSAFANADGFRVEFLVSNRGSDDLTGALVPMPALGGVSAQPLRYLDFLIRDPVRSTLLHAGGISVTVPAPERYAVHKLIVANERTEREKQAKDLTQAELPDRSPGPEPTRCPGSLLGRGVEPRSLLAPSPGNRCRTPRRDRAHRHHASRLRAWRNTGLRADAGRVSRIFLRSGHRSA